MDDRSELDRAVLPPTRAVRIIRRVADPLFIGTGIAAVLTVAGRRSGAPHSVKVTPVDLGKARYLISFHGETNWVLNLRVAGRCDLRRLGQTTAWTAVEVVGNERDLVLAKYLARLPGPLRSDYSRRLAAEHHPVFRVERIATR